MNKIFTIISILLLAFLIGCVDNSENEAPTCAILSPMPGLSYTIGDTVPISAQASDADGSIFEIKLYINGQGVAFANNDTLSYNWLTNNYSPGQYIVTFTAIDNLLSTESVSINLSLVADNNYPSLMLDSLNSITFNSAIIYGKVLDAGDSELSELGICWSTDANPTITDNRTTAVLNNDNTFQIHLTSIAANTTYYLRAYAENNAGNAYSNEMSFTTPEDLSFIETSTYTDPRDGQTYATVKIGDVWWLAENLNYYTNNSFYYNNDSSTFHSFGRLYNINEAKTVCPPGWHLASDDEWKSLETALGMPPSDINSTGYRGTNQGSLLKVGGESHFEAKLGGYGTLDFNFNDFTVGYWWSDTELSTGEYYIREISDYYSTISRSTLSNFHLLNVRCVKD